MEKPVLYIETFRIYECMNLFGQTWNEVIDFITNDNPDYEIVIIPPGNDSDNDSENYSENDNGSEDE